MLAAVAAIAEAEAERMWVTAQDSRQNLVFAFLYSVVGVAVAAAMGMAGTDVAMESAGWRW